MDARMWYIPAPTADNTWENTVDCKSQSLLTMHDISHKHDLLNTIIYMVYTEVFLNLSIYLVASPLSLLYNNAQ